MKSGRLQDWQKLKNYVPNNKHGVFCPNGEFSLDLLPSVRCVGRSQRGSCTHRARTVQSFDICVFMGNVFPRFQAQRPPPKRASKTSALARKRQREKRQAAKSVKIDISDEDWQEVVDRLLRRRQETSGKNQYVSTVEYFLERW